MGFILSAIAGSRTASPGAAAVGALGIASILVVLVAGPAALWRRYRARRAGAAARPAAAQPLGPPPPLDDTRARAGPAPARPGSDRGGRGGTPAPLAGPDS